MPDMNIWMLRSGEVFTGASDYPDVTKKAIVEMHRQVGVLKLDHQGMPFVA